MRTDCTGRSEFASTDDATVEAWLERARRGDEESLALLRGWAYRSAKEYFKIAARRERFITSQDVEEMTSGFFLEFDREWRKIRSATRYARFMMSTWVARYLKKKRIRLQREVLVESTDVAAPDEGERPWRAWDDLVWSRYRAILTQIARSDGLTRAVVTGRLSDPPRPYRELSRELDTTETALRMRMTRFYRAVREARVTVERCRAPLLRDLPQLADVIREAPPQPDTLGSDAEHVPSDGVCY